MTIDDKLRAIRDVIQQDVGNRGLARDPTDNLINACPDDFASACRSIASYSNPTLAVVTGFYIQSADPPAHETDGPLGAVFLARSLSPIGVRCAIITEPAWIGAIEVGLGSVGLASNPLESTFAFPSDELVSLWIDGDEFDAPYSVLLAPLERVGPATNGRCHSMRGRDVTANTAPAHELFSARARPGTASVTIGIGDGGNEIGMGRIPHETIVKNIPNGGLIHCRVPTDHLIVAGVSNWGAYALAAGVALLRGVELPGELFDPVREREILEVMVRKGPLVDGVTGKQTATVDGLSWEQYIQPLVRIGEIVRM